MHSHDLWHIFEHSLTDTLVALSKRTVMRALSPRTPVPVGNRLTYALGSVMDAVNMFFHRIFKCRKPIRISFVNALAAVAEDADQDLRTVSRTMSYGLLMFSVGLLFALVYLLTR